MGMRARCPSSALRPALCGPRSATRPAPRRTPPASPPTLLTVSAARIAGRQKLRRRSGEAGAGARAAGAHRLVVGLGRGGRGRDAGHPLLLIREEAPVVRALVAVAAQRRDLLLRDAQLLLCNTRPRQLREQRRTRRGCGGAAAGAGAVGRSGAAGAGGSRRACAQSQAKQRAAARLTRRPFGTLTDRAPSPPRRTPPGRSPA